MLDLQLPSPSSFLFPISNSQRTKGPRWTRTSMKKRSFRGRRGPTLSPTSGGYMQCKALICHCTPPSAARPTLSAVIIAADGGRRFLAPSSSRLHNHGDGNCVSLLHGGSHERSEVGLEISNRTQPKWSRSNSKVRLDGLHNGHRLTDFQVVGKPRQKHWTAQMRHTPSETPRRATSNS